MGLTISAPLRLKLREAGNVSLVYFSFSASLNLSSSSHLGPVTLDSGFPWGTEGSTGPYSDPREGKSSGIMKFHYRNGF